MTLLTFDAHNHIHLGTHSVHLNAMATLAPSSTTGSIVNSNNGDNRAKSSLCGLAIMSTHPRDYPTVLELSRSIPIKVVPCFGVHPWFLHELDETHWKPCDTLDHIRGNQENDIHSQGTNSPFTSPIPSWLQELEDWIQSTPDAIVGEIGMDGFHFDSETGELTSSMEQQIMAFEAQMDIAYRWNRPVSIHTVQCFGQLMTSLSKLKKKTRNNPQSSAGQGGLPPKIYFHAFGGKVGTVDQLLSLCETKSRQVYFGFAPVVNFRSPKTASVIRKVGLHRIVLETDHEDAALVPDSMGAGIALLSDALNVSPEEVVVQTTRNAFDLYGLEGRDMGTDDAQT